MERKKNSDDDDRKKKVKTDTPEMEKNQWVLAVKREWKIRTNHPAAEAERKGIEEFAKGERQETSYYNNGKEHSPVSIYDRRFHFQYGYHQKLRSDNDIHTLGLDVNSEEQNKAIPLLSSSVYGHRKAIDTPNHNHYRIEYRQEFYRNGGTNIPTGQ